MKAAPVAQLKASLSRYLAGVKAGEEVLVTERGKPIAKIVPVRGGGQDQESLRLKQLELRGLVRRGERKLSKSFWDAPRLSDPAGEARRALQQERDEGR